ncbi:hypothetical protein COZ61_01340 [Candidatus Berkelbacteria bacterium CG_4_8_14_3_um_filter_33_6]|uniref:Uncharacterized protein n=1 Tax=Candidatus Berkelbacteria bacterium CG_4_10_14_0_2_um_filter_35_9_33_12 TaxID=1974499 RepID=A0A2M7W4B0_9BACT|nr:MAG: hypothetical protein COX10_01240 [Candidatus Berkelbacteria bacterium CG23_combo_of_CG06-09_8_20_14_all_33_15]PIS08199.1 MAG: hypothetical protein COT76_02790 [Candidatus Berkelbacteria bacterium CG10_big_fil_rev_8_21_14_0_10_33_10]PIX31141.1 MAG: hypothetical protein COZ61_01340 [Candidatus Berkelbacteria bacterium CG_4_8_14_3_um_filter_33_6]PIZ28158.1 MAG: hypothetical protein COY43_01945 [Candidatus Berkelbacteria bacterium CG_4_10_14_0_8_um_filter_35_9_33_8]PJA20591.1 MAG: hypotheti
MKTNLFLFVALGLLVGWVQSIFFSLNIFVNLYLLIGIILLIIDKKSQLKLTIFLFTYSILIINSSYFGLIFILIYLWLIIAKYLLNYYHNFSIFPKILIIFLLVLFWHLIFWVIFKPSFWQTIFLYVLIETSIILLMISFYNSKQKKLIITS